MKKFRIKQYEIHTDKIHAPQGVRMILLADLHGISYGKDNIRLTETIRKLAPDVILSAGDMAVRTETNTILRNGREDMVLQGEHFCFWGLELPIEYYHKPRSPKLKKEVMEEMIGKPEDKGMQILLAHNPKYGKTYFEWGADLILSGHYHGGVVRLSEHYGLSSPQYLFLPPFCCGDFHKGDQHMIVSAGLGEHTIPLRIHNPRELLVIDIKPSEKMK